MIARWQDQHSRARDDHFTLTGQEAMPSWAAFVTPRLVPALLGALVLNACAYSTANQARGTGVFASRDLDRAVSEIDSVMLALAAGDTISVYRHFAVGARVDESLAEVASRSLVVGAWERRELVGFAFDLSNGLLELEFEVPVRSLAIHCYGDASGDRVIAGLIRIDSAGWRVERMYSPIC